LSGGSITDGMPPPLFCASSTAGPETQTHRTPGGGTLGELTHPVALRTTSNSDHHNCSTNSATHNNARGVANANANASASAAGAGEGGAHQTAQSKGGSNAKRDKRGPKRGGRFVCPHPGCGESFSRAYTLAIHARTHEYFDEYHHWKKLPQIARESTPYATHHAAAAYATVENATGALGGFAGKTGDRGNDANGGNVGGRGASRGSGEVTATQEGGTVGHVNANVNVAVAHGDERRALELQQIAPELLIPAQKQQQTRTQAADGGGGGPTEITNAPPQVQREQLAIPPPVGADSTVTNVRTMSTPISTMSALAPHMPVELDELEEMAVHAGQGIRLQHAAGGTLRSNTAAGGNAGGAQGVPRLPFEALQPYHHTNRY